MVLLAIITLYPTWELKFLLFAKDPFIKVKSFAIASFSGIYVRPRFK
jgi:hypothetical protein